MLTREKSSCERMKEIKIKILLFTESFEKHNNGKIMNIVHNLYTNYVCDVETTLTFVILENNI